MSSESITISDILVQNLHCDSCSRTIESILSSLSPPPLSFWVSIASRLLRVHHLNALSADAILAALEDSGFDIAKAPSDAAVYSGPSFVENSQESSSSLAEKRRKHIQQCSLCIKGTKDGTTNDSSHADSIHVSENPLSFDRPSSPEGPVFLTFSVSGMSCASCSHSITNALSELSGVSDVVVSVLGKTVTAVAQHRKLVDSIRSAVEDCGFEAQIVDVEPVKSEITTKLAEPSREVSLRVDGMFCRHCPEKAMAALDSLGSKVTALKSITTCKDPILKISYQPALPSLTIRTIVSAISAANSPPFNVSVYKPIPFEERARDMDVREQRRLLYRFFFSVIMAIPTFIIAVVYMSLVKYGNSTKTYLMEPMWTGNTSRAVWALFFMATPVMFYSANLFHQRSIKEIRMLWRRGSTTPILKRFVRFGSMNLLVSSGVSVAYFSSVVLLGLSATGPASQEGAGDNTTYFDSVVFLTMFLLAGRFLEAYSKGHTASAITALGMLRPAEAFVLMPRSHPSLPSSASDDLEKGHSTSENMSLSTQPGATFEKISVDLLEVGDIVRVQTGSSPPCDGRIISVNDSAFDESSLTGESRLIKKQKGDLVYLGTINKLRMVDIEVEAIGGGTMLDQIIKVVRQGQTHRAPIERVADLLTGYFVPVVTLLAIITWVVWLTLGLSGAIPTNTLGNGVGGWPVWSLEFAIAVFVVACPCGIGLAAPTAFLVGSGLAAKFGILPRGGGEAFQEMAQLDVVVFDKTGTLTEGGEPRVSDFEVFPSSDGFSPEVVLGIAAEIEFTSSHPLAIAVRNFCEGHGTSPVTGSDFMETAGRGLKAYFGTLRCTAIIGNEPWIEEHGVVISDDIARKLEQWKSEAKSIILLALRLDESRTEAPFSVAAIFAVTDPLRPEAKDVVQCLQEQGIGTWMISGDNVTTAEAVARTVGIPGTNVIAGVLPHEKAEKIQWLQRVGSKRVSKWQSWFGTQRLNMRCIVAMVGDGINDAPALTAADIGIAIGSGSDVAISSASFILVSSNLQGLITLSDLSRKVFNRVKFNFLWAVLYNLVALPVAAGLLYPAGHARLNPIWASLAMALSSVSVVCSSLLLKLYKEPRWIRRR